MADHVFFEKGRNRGNTRAITIKGARLLPGRAPSNLKRIIIPVVMPLSNQKTAGTPDWIADAHAFVAKSGDTVSPEVKFKGFDIDFATENRNLFNDGKISAPKCSMSGFSVHTQGSEEEPDIVLSFTIHAPFSTQLWDYLGQVSNDDVWARFEQSAAAESDDDQEDLELDEDAGDDDADETDEGDEDGEDEEDIEAGEEEEDTGTDDDTTPDEDGE